MDNIMLAAGILFAAVVAVMLYKYIREVFFATSDKIYVGKETGSRYAQNEQDLSEFR